MQIGYLTMDDVNLAYASELANKVGGIVIGLPVCDDLHALFVDALLIDIDHLPKEIVADYLSRIDRTPPPFPAYGHSYEVLLDPLKFQDVENFEVVPRLAYVLVEEIVRESLARGNETAVFEADVESSAASNYALVGEA